MNVAQAIGSLECPDVGWIEKDQAPLASCDHPERPGARRRPPAEQASQALLHALFAERLEQIIDHSQFPCPLRMLAVGCGQHERRSRALWVRGDRRLDEVETALAAAKLNVDEDDVHRESGQRLARLTDAGDRS